MLLNFGEASELGRDYFDVEVSFLSSHVEAALVEEGEVRRAEGGLQPVEEHGLHA